MTMTNTDWHEWPQLEFDIEQFEDVQDWVINRFGEDTTEVILVGKGTYNFHVAIKDPKIINYTLLKFTGCRLQPNQQNKDIIAEEIKKQTDADIKRLIEKVHAKLKDIPQPSYEEWNDAVSESVYFTNNNGVWTNVKE